MAQVRQSLKSRLIRLPVYGAGADLAAGAILIPGVTAETDDGVLINSTATSLVDAIGVLAELHDYSESGDALVTGAVSWFQLDTANARTQLPARQVELLDAHTILKIPYDTSDTAAVASYSAPTVTISSLEDNIDTAFLYIVGGTGAGQLGFVDTSAAGSCTVDTNFTTALDNTSTVIKILPLFHNLVKIAVATATAETKIGTDAAAGSARIVVIANHMVRRGLDEFMDPLYHDTLSGLSSLARLEFYSEIAVQNTALHPVD